MGRIRLMRTLNNDSSEGLDPEKIKKLESCLGCYTCETVCPSRVDFGKMLDESLALLREHRPIQGITRMMLFMAEKRSLLTSLIQTTYLSQAIGLRGLFEKIRLYELLGMQRANALLGRVSFPASLWNHIHRPVYNQRVALFTGCFSSVMEQTVQQSAINVLNALGLEVTQPDKQGCCGALHRHNGDLITAAKMARKNIKAFSNSVDAIITTSSGCGAGLKAYSKWLEGDDLTSPVMDVNDYLANALRKRSVLFDRLPLKVALHTPCTLRQGEGQEEAVIELLQKIPELEVVPLSGEPRCCGAGGSQMLSQPDMADALRDDIVDEIKAMDVDMIISSNLGCAMHLRNGLANAGLDIPLQHPVQLIAKAIVEEFVAVKR